MMNKLCQVNLNDLKEQALQLSWKERLRLAQDLLESLHPEGPGEADASGPTV